jgi:hypothetical protein
MTLNSWRAQNSWHSIFHDNELISIIDVLLIQYEIFSTHLYFSKWKDFFYEYDTTSLMVSVFGESVHEHVRKLAKYEYC